MNLTCHAALQTPNATLTGGGRRSDGGTLSSWYALAEGGPIRTATNETRSLRSGLLSTLTSDTLTSTPESTSLAMTPMVLDAGGQWAEGGTYRNLLALGQPEPVTTIQMNGLRSLQGFLGTLDLHSTGGSPSPPPSRTWHIVFDAGGLHTTGSTYSNFYALAQPGPVTIASTGSRVLSQGFLGSFSTGSDHDTDGDGLADTRDPDNDNDGILDIYEITGSAFNPATSTDINRYDSDGDGMADGDEAISGTNPADSNQLLRILAVQVNSNATSVIWAGRSNITYRILASHDLLQPNSFSNLLATVVSSSTSAGPWMVTTETYVDTNTAAQSFYVIEVVP